MEKWYDKNIEPPSDNIPYLCFLEDTSITMCKYIDKKWVEYWMNRIEQSVVFWTYYPIGINGRVIMRDMAIRKYKLNKINVLNEIENR